MGCLSYSEFIELTSIRNAVEYAALVYARSHREYGPWIVGKLGLLILEADEVDGKITLLPYWQHIQPTPIELMRAYERAAGKEKTRAKRASI